MDRKIQNNVVDMWKKDITKTEQIWLRYNEIWSP